MKIFDALIQIKTIRTYSVFGSLASLGVFLICAVQAEEGSIPAFTIFAGGNGAFWLVVMGILARRGHFRKETEEFLSVEDENRQEVSLICFFFAAITAAIVLHFAF